MARRAGPSEASTVTRMPITRPRTMSLGATATSIGAVAGSSGSSAKPAPTTAATPIAEETSPSTSASSSTERWIWPPVAPRQRSSASSRARWAVSTPKVVVITRKATSTASMAKASRKADRPAAAPAMSSRASSVCSCGVCTRKAVSPGRDSS